ncbi:ParB/RepB/Spo0J family partition protein, partial [Kribbella catacumbae]|uniref:ParB/RepB/Spo0J family partition protein n=1 Tax=Kribbella catacumbae TaxID=460086 RepID=UPI00036922C5
MNDRIITQLDPKTLLVNVNVRNELAITPEFVASIRRRGVLQAIVAVRTAEGQIRVKYGHRRTHAAIEVGLDTVPVDIIGDEGTDKASQIERILSQYDENEARTGLTTNDTLGVVEQLRLLDMSQAEIARQSPLTKAQVGEAVKVLKSAPARAAHDEHQLTIDQAAALAEFEDNEKDFAEALNIAKVNPRQLNHTVSTLRQKRKARAELAEFITTQLEPLGVTIIDRPFWNSPWKPLDRLTTITGEDVTLEQHAECPGHVVWAGEDYAYFRADGTRVDEDSEEAAELDQEDEPEKGTYRSFLTVTYGCADPAKHGHQVDGRPAKAANGESPIQTPEEVKTAHEAKLAEKRRVIANNKAWDAAEVVRREWISKNIANRR